jgi:ribosomal-protein-alanine N-acetyltransferase
MTPPSDDLDAIMAVMQAAFDPAYGEAWSRRQVEDALLFGNSYYGLIARNGDMSSQIVESSGFYLSRFGFEEEELLLLAVVPEDRHRGFGRALLTHFAQAAKSRGAHRLLLEMRRGNQAEALYRAFGFVQIGERRDYYRTPSGERIDALTFAYDITQDSPAAI